MILKFNFKMEKMVHVIVILGCRVVLTGGDKGKIGVLSHVYGRLMESIKVYNEITEKKVIICTGHNGEAEIMKKFLVDNGIETGDIVCEPLARNTIENCILSYKMINMYAEKEKRLDLHLVTDEYHMERSKAIFSYFKSFLNFPTKFLHCHSSRMLDYIDNPTVLQKAEIKHAYEKDIYIIKNFLQKSLLEVKIK